MNNNENNDYNRNISNDRDFNYSPGYSDNQNSGYPDNRNSGYPDTRKSGYNRDSNGYNGYDNENLPEFNGNYERDNNMGMYVFCIFICLHVHICTHTYHDEIMEPSPLISFFFIIYDYDHHDH